MGFTKYNHLRECPHCGDYIYSKNFQSLHYKWDNFFVFLDLCWNYDIIFWVQTALADPGFSPGGCTNSQKCYYFSIFLPKTTWKWKNLQPQGGASLAPPLGSANGQLKINGKSVELRAVHFYMHCLDLFESVYIQSEIKRWWSVHLPR